MLILLAIRAPQCARVQRVCARVCVLVRTCACQQALSCAMAGARVRASMSAHACVPACAPCSCLRARACAPYAFSPCVPACASMLLTWKYLPPCLWQCCSVLPPCLLMLSASTCASMLLMLGTQRRASMFCSLVYTPACLHAVPMCTGLMCAQVCMCVHMPTCPHKCYACSACPCMHATHVVLCHAC